MVWVDGRGRVDLQAVVAFASVLKQTVHGVQHFMGQQEEPLSANRGEGEGADRSCTSSITAYILQKDSLNEKVIYMYCLYYRAKPP